MIPVVLPNYQCCGSGSGICFFLPSNPGSRCGIRAGKNPDPRSGMNILDNFSESLETVFRVKNTYIL
jgi:hypothetical protein